MVRMGDAGAGGAAYTVGQGCICDTCRRLVAGTDGDAKVCAFDGEANLILCSECFRRDARRGGWLEWRSVVLPRRGAT
jgi:hypothetical protein